jgi:ribosomal protein S18 acetylase RimI-like enzyme
VIGTVDCAALPNLTRGARPFMLVENVVVSGEYRRAGVGSALLEAAMRLARQAGCYKVQLLSRAERSAAHAFYESRGFRPVAQGYRRYLD